jgi:hypothetical protein
MGFLNPDVCALASSQPGKSILVSSSTEAEKDTGCPYFGKFLE